MKKRLFSLVLALVLCMGLAVPAMAAKATETKIDSGTGHCAFVDANGDLWMWGNNADGQLGNHSTVSTVTPVKVMSDVASVSLSDYGSAAVKTDGTLWVWGQVKNFFDVSDQSIFALFDFSNSTITYPLKLTYDVVSVSFGLHELAVIKTDRSLWIWGDENLYPGSIGSGKGVKVMDDVLAVEAGSGNYAILKTDGTLWMLGVNSVGQLGNGEAPAMDDGEAWRSETVTTPFQLMEDVVAMKNNGSTMAAVPIGWDTVDVGSEQQLADGTWCRR